MTEKPPLQEDVRVAFEKEWTRTAQKTLIAFANTLGGDLYLGLNEEEGVNWGVIRGGMSSVARLFVAQMQDYLGLGAEARINEPGSTGNNWRWRLLPGQLDKKLCDRIYEYTRMYGRANPLSRRAKAEAEK